jgi:hypothetical protein
VIGLILIPSQRFSEKRSEPSNSHNIHSLFPRHTSEGSSHYETVDSTTGVSRDISDEISSPSRIDRENARWPLCDGDRKASGGIHAILLSHHAHRVLHGFRGLNHRMMRNSRRNFHFFSAFGDLRPAWSRRQQPLHLMANYNSDHQSPDFTYS